MTKETFYLTSPHHWCGNSVMFHSIDGSGYTTNLDHAEIINHKKAQVLVDEGHLRDYPNQEMPLSVAQVNQLSEWRVDSQYVNKTYPEFTDPNDEYVSVRSNYWDGNDIAFGDGCGWSLNYSNAKSFSKSDIDPYIDNLNQSMYFIPKYHADEIARRTFQKQHINRRKMITGAGVVGLRKKRASKSSGKTRWNCPTCGKIVWQFHPYEFQSCSDINCQSYDGYLASC